MHTKFERLLSKSLTTLEVMSYYLVVHTGPGHTNKIPRDGNQVNKGCCSPRMWKKKKEEEEEEDGEEED